MFWTTRIWPQTNLMSNFESWHNCVVDRSADEAFLKYSCFDFTDLIAWQNKASVIPQKWEKRLAKFLSREKYVDKTTKRKVKTYNRSLIHTTSTSLICWNGHFNNIPFQRCYGRLMLKLMQHMSPLKIQFVTLLKPDFSPVTHETKHK